MKNTFLIIFLILSSNMLLAQPTLEITNLDCFAWGTANWSKYNKYSEGKDVDYMSSPIREQDRNIKAIYPMEVSVYRKEIYLRWEIIDTSISYKVRITNKEDEVLFEKPANNCGIKIPLDVFASEEGYDYIFVLIERSLTHSYNWGLTFVIKPMDAQEKRIISDKLYTVMIDVPSDKKWLTLVNFFLEKNLNLDALAVLENHIEMNPNDQEVIDKYWEVLNDLRIKPRRD